MQIDVDPDQDFHVAIDGVARALSLDALDEAYQANLITDETLIWQEGFKDWMRLDTLLATLGAQESEEPPAPEPPAIDPHNYAVLVAPEEVKSMTLETLAQAHRAGAVHEETLVRPPGQSDWVPLAVVIASFSRQPQPGAAPIAAQPHSAQPSAPAYPTAAPAADPHAGAGYAAPASQIPSAAASLTRPSAAAAPAASAAPSSSGAAFSSGGVSHSGAASHSVAPTAAAPSAHSSVAPAAFPSLAPTAASIAPPPSGVGLSGAGSGLDDLDFPAFQNSRAVWIKRSAVGLGAIAAVSVAFLAMSGSEEEATAQVDGVATKSVAAVSAPEPEAEPSAWEKEKALLEEARLKDEAAAREAASQPVADAFGASLAGDPKPKTTNSAPARNVPRPKAKKPAGPAKAKGSQYDPMNGAL